MSSEPPRWYRRRIVIVVAAVVAVLACAAAVFALTRPGDVFNPDVEFRAEPTQTSVPTAVPGVKPKQKKKKKKKKVDPLAGFAWAQYGYSRDRRRYLPTEASVRPPFKLDWSWSSHVLLEFPPIIVGNRLFVVGNAGVVVALNRLTGKRVWKRDMGYLGASSPAYGNKKIFVTILERTKGGDGRVAAIWAKSGRVSWSKPLPSRSESSPLAVDGRVYFGTEDGTVYALRADDGSVQWKFRAGGAAKGGLALADGKLYFGTYGGHVYAIGQRTGKQVWHTGTSGARFGLSAGNFYSTPAVAFGRMYIGNTDGNMYSFSSTTGKLAWRRGTGSYVYASPAVAQVRGGKPTVYFGSYDGTFYALDARSGATRWTYGDGGKISGAATVIGDLVYYSNWGKRNTTALGARTGRRVWTNPRGAFNPVVSNGQTLYLTGFSSVGAFEPLTVAEENARAARHAAKVKKQKAARKRAAAKKALAKKCRAAAKKKVLAKKKALAEKCRAAAARKKKAAAKKNAAAKKRAAAKKKALAKKRARAKRRAERSP
jgi:outer membrane protein assembly factor BamB